MKTVTKDGEIHVITEPTEAAYNVSKAIIETMREAKVTPVEVMAVLGEAIIRTLVPIAQYLECDEEEYIHCFGEGLATCELQLKKKTKGN
jgi:hypothetical protein